jgi:hypothetical protein
MEIALLYDPDRDLGGPQPLAVTADFGGDHMI